MSTFLQSTGKQFTQSPGKQRDAFSRQLFFEEGESMALRKYTSDEVRAIGGLSFASIPVHPDINYLWPDVNGVPTNRSTEDWFYEETVLLGPVDGNPIGYYYGSWPRPSPAASLPELLSLSNVLGSPTYVGRIAYELSIPAPVNFPLPIYDIGARSGTAAAAQGYNFLCHFSYFTHLTSEFGFPATYFARKSRFRTLFPARAWLGRCSLNESSSYAIIPPLEILNEFTIAPMTWYDVPTPWDYEADPPANTMYVIVHSETPAEWSARTGIPIV